MKKSRRGKNRSVWQKEVRKDACTNAEEQNVENEAICYLRDITELLLQKRRLSYRDICLILLDRGQKVTEEAESSIFTWESGREETDSYVDGQIVDALCQMTEGLNHLTICTDRREFFTCFAERMQQEYGLIVALTDKTEQRPVKNGLVLDFEYGTCMKEDFFKKDMIYLPVYKRPWQIAENLDISVPIGYNTVIVKGAIKQNVSSYPDRFERGFYEN